MSDSDQFPDAWQSRIGDRAADARRRFLRARLTGVILVSLLIAGAIWITVLFVTQNGDPSPALVALIAVVGAVWEFWDLPPSRSRSATTTKPPI